MHIYSAIKTIADYIKWVNLKNSTLHKRRQTQNRSHIIPWLWRRQQTESVTAGPGAGFASWYGLAGKGQKTLSTVTRMSSILIGSWLHGGLHSPKRISHPPKICMSYYCKLCHSFFLGLGLKRSVMGEKLWSKPRFDIIKSISCLKRRVPFRSYCSAPARWEEDCQGGVLESCTFRLPPHCLCPLQPCSGTLGAQPGCEPCVCLQADCSLWHGETQGGQEERQCCARLEHATLGTGILVARVPRT